jgi:hypothetical protein
VRQRSSYGWVVLGAAFVMITLAIGTLFSLAVFLNHPRRAGLLPLAFPGVGSHRDYGHRAGDKPQAAAGHPA